MASQQQTQGFEAVAGPGRLAPDGSSSKPQAIDGLKRGKQAWRKLLLRAYGGLGQLLGIDPPGESLATGDDRFRLMIESSYATVIHVDCSGVVRWISPSLERMLGWLPAEWIGRSVSDFVVPEDIDRLNSNIQKIIATAEPLTERYQAKAKDGSIHWIETYASILEDANGAIDGIVATFRTIDLEVRSELELGENRAMQEQQLLVSLKAAAVAHELKQPLTMLSLKSRQLARECILVRDGKASDLVFDHECILSEEVKNQVQIMVGTVKAMGGMLGSMHLHIDAIDLSKVVGDAIEFCRLRLEAEAIQLECIGVEGPVIIRGNADLLFIAIRNLIDNAIDELSLVANTSKAILIALEESAVGISLRVADSGRGFPHDQGISPYPPSTKQDGWGIGLINVHNIVKNHSGYLEFGSSPLGGAEVLLKLPPLPPRVKLSIDNEAAPNKR